MENSHPLLTRIPFVAGKVRSLVSLADLTWFRVGGLAEVMFIPQDEEDLGYFLKNLSSDIPLWVLGVGSNVLVRDGGVQGVTLRLGSSFSRIEREGKDGLRVGAACLDRAVARFALESELKGFAFLEGIPGTIGGALRMNAGAHGGEIKDLVVEVEAFDRKGKKHILSGEEMGFSYRSSRACEDLVFTKALLKGELGLASEIALAMEEVRRTRVASQPIRSRTGGSTFKNPPGQKAWELIDHAGMRGSHFGGASVSTMHCNFLINEGNATALELETLGEHVQQAVYEKTGFLLEWEIKRVGVHV